MAPISGPRKEYLARSLLFGTSLVMTGCCFPKKHSFHYQEKETYRMQFKRTAGQVGAKSLLLWTQMSPRDIHPPTAPIAPWSSKVRGPLLGGRALTPEVEEGGRDPHTRTLTDTRTPPAARRLLIGGRRRVGPGRPKTNNLRGDFAAARPPGLGLCELSGEPRPPWPPRSPTPLPSAPRPRLLAVAAGLYWAWAKVEARRSSGPRARRCSFGGPGRKGVCGHHGVGDWAPRALKAEGSIPSPRSGTHTRLALSPCPEDACPGPGLLDE